MRRFLILILLIGVTGLCFLGIQAAPAHAQAPGPCSSLNGATFSTAANAPFITAPFQFQAGDTVEYTLTYDFPAFTPTSVTVETSLGVSFSPVATATFSTSPITPSATVAYTFTAPQLTEMRFDWSFSGAGSFAPHTINTVVNCGQQAATIPTLTEWGLLFLTLALAAVGTMRLSRSS
jgi:hypothetical protein